MAGTDDGELDGQGCTVAFNGTRTVHSPHCLLQSLPVAYYCIFPTNSSNKYRESCGPGAASGWYCTEKAG